MYAETYAQAREAITRFAAEYGAKYPKAVTALEQDAEAPLTFFDFPAEHWKHLRTSDRVAVRDRAIAAARDEGGPGSRTKGLLMAYELLDMAQARWRRLDGARLLPLVSTRVMFVDGLKHLNKQPQGRAHGPRRLLGVRMQAADGHGRGLQTAQVVSLATSHGTITPTDGRSLAAPF
jgi:hypothetical protein